MTKSEQIKRAFELLTEIDNIVCDLVRQSALPQQPVKPNNRKKLTKRDVLLIRQMKRNGETQAAIAETFDVSPPTISRIVRGQYWR